MTELYLDVSHYDRDRRGAPLDWSQIAAAGLSGIMVARASYGDPQVYAPATRHFGEHMDGAKAAGFQCRGGYHNLIHGDAASIARQVDFLRAQLDRHDGTWAMLDVEPYTALKDPPTGNGLWPRWSDVQLFTDRWMALESRVLAYYIGRWVWSGYLGRADLRLLPGPLINAHYGPLTAGTEPAQIYGAGGGDTGPGWAPYGTRVPDILQFTSKAVVPGSSQLTDVNAFRGSDLELTRLLGGIGVTTAPAGLLAARQLLLEHLDMHPGVTVGSDLDPAEVGIVGDAAHVGGYHCGRDRVVRDSVGNITDYSVIESPRDRAGLSLNAAGFDIGEFSVTTAKGTFDLRDFNRWLIAELNAGAPDTLDIREVIYSLDGVTVLRWDRLKRRSTGTGSHRTHTHVSEFRDANGRNMVALMTRWLTHIGLMGDDVEITDVVPWQSAAQKTRMTTAGWSENGLKVAALLTYTFEASRHITPGTAAKLEEILAAALDDGDTTVVLPPEAIAELTQLKDAIAALPDAAELRDAVADLGEGGAAQVREDAPPSS